MNNTQNCSISNSNKSIIKLSKSKRESNDFNLKASFNILRPQTNENANSRVTKNFNNLKNNDTKSKGNIKKEIPNKKHSLKEEYNHNKKNKMDANTSKNISSRNIKVNSFHSDNSSNIGVIQSLLEVKEEMIAFQTKRIKLLKNYIKKSLEKYIKNRYIKNSFIEWKNYIRFKKNKRMFLINSLRYKRKLLYFLSWKNLVNKMKQEKRYAIFVFVTKIKARLKEDFRMIHYPKKNTIKFGILLGLLISNCNCSIIRTKKIIMKKLLNTLRQEKPDKLKVAHNKSKEYKKELLKLRIEFSNVRNAIRNWSQVVSIPDIN